MAFEIVTPREIEQRSMETITKELNGRTWPEPEFSVIKRCIHTSADFDYADNLCFSPNACQIGIEALKNGADIVTDTKMAMSGINKNKLSTFGGEVHCYISDPDVVEEAKARGCTRSTVSMERGARIKKPVIFVVGNAPTALIELDKLIKEGKVNPPSSSESLWDSSMWWSPRSSSCRPVYPTSSPGEGRAEATSAPPSSTLFSTPWAGKQFKRRDCARRHNRGRRTDREVRRFHRCR
jgi:precorrin-8X/cobalt-precorrin-8 methylmutase